MEKFSVKGLLELKNKLYQIFQKIDKSMKDFKNEYGYLIKPLFILTFILILSITSIIRANVNYLDDIGRVYRGNRGFTYFSRYVPEYLSIVIHANEYLTDISPFPQLLAMFIIALSGTILLHIFNRNKKISFLNIISVLPIGICPYFLECISYKYDSPYMALSIFFCVVPFLFYGEGKKKKIGFAISVFLCTLLMCMTYQATSGIIPMVTMFLAFDLWNSKETKKAIDLIWIAALSFLLGLISFRVVIMTPYDNYASTEIFPLKDLIPGTINNLKIYYDYVQKDFRRLWLVIINIVSICFIIYSVIHSKQNKILTAIFSTSILFVSSIIVFGVYPCLVKGLFTPRAMYAMGVFISLIFVNATKYGCKINIPKIFSAILVWCFFIFTFTYGNALYEQNRYIDFRVQQTINAINELECTNTDILKQVEICGTIGKVDTLNRYPEKLNFLINRLVRQSFDGVFMWDYEYFYNYFNMKHIMRAQREPLPNELIVVKDTMYYTLEADITDDTQDYIRITLK